MPRASPWGRGCGKAVRPEGHLAPRALPVLGRRCHQRNLATLALLALLVSWLTGAPESAAGIALRPAGHRVGDVGFGEAAGRGAVPSPADQHRPRARVAQQPADRQRDIAGQAYLPILTATPMEVCAAAGPMQAKPDAAAGLVVHCGGFGRIRDLYGSLASGPLAVGDGVAQLLASGTEGHWAWSTQLGPALVGLNALALTHVASSECPRPPCGWAVGDGDRIVRYADAVFRPHSGGDDGRVQLLSLDISDAEEGWAVGRFETESGVTAALRVLRHTAHGLGWFDAADVAAELPELSDVQVFVDGLGQEIAAWAVGSTDGRGTFVRGGPDAFEVWRWQIAQEVSGAPRELALAEYGSYGWAFGFGQTSPQATPGLLSWRYGQPGTWWPYDFVLPGRQLVDAYLVSPSEGEPEVWLAASTTDPAAPVVYRIPKGSPIPEPVGPALRDAPQTRDAANRAVAPLLDGSVLYAWGDQVWLLDAAHRTWTRLRSRWRLRDAAPTPRGLWLLADEGDGSALLFYGPTGLYAVAGGELAEPLPRQNALASAGEAVWAVGDAGTILRLGSSLRAWEPWSPGRGLDGDLLDAVADGSGRLWVVGVGSDGWGRLWSVDSGGWQERARTGAPARLQAVAMAGDGAVWAAGEGCLLRLEPGCEAGPSAACATEVAVPGSLVDVTAVGRDGVLAAAESYLVEATPTGVTLLGLYRADGTAILPYGAHLVAVAAANQVCWAVAQCCGGLPTPDREYSLVLRNDGVAWSEVATVSVPLAALTVDHSVLEGRLWAVGDWTTVLSTP